MNEAKLSMMGWKILVVWECETINIIQLEETIKNFLDS